MPKGHGQRQRDKSHGDAGEKDRAGTSGLKYALNARSNFGTFGLLIDMIGVLILRAWVISKVEAELSRQYNAPERGISVAADPYLGRNPICVQTPFASKPYLRPNIDRIPSS